MGILNLFSLIFILWIFVYRSKEVAKINHTFVIELKAEKSDILEFGSEMPENEIEQTELEVKR